MNLPDIDAAIDAAKDRWDHAGAPYDPAVLKLIRAAEAMRAYIGSIHGPDTDDPMPVFVLKAKDLLAQSAVLAYLDTCDQHGLPRQARHVLRAADEFTAWQERHPDLLQMPDHEHVPVGDALLGVDH